MDMHAGSLSTKFCQLLTSVITLLYKCSYFKPR